MKRQKTLSLLVLSGILFMGMNLFAKEEVAAVKCAKSTNKDHYCWSGGAAKFKCVNTVGTDDCSSTTQSAEVEP